MNENFWWMVDVYRKHRISKADYNAFKSEVRRTALDMTRLSLLGIIYDVQVYPDTGELSDTVMDIRIFEKRNLPEVRRILNSKIRLRYEVREMEFEDDDGEDDTHKDSPLINR